MKSLVLACALLFGGPVFAFTDIINGTSTFEFSVLAGGQGCVQFDELMIGNGFPEINGTQVSKLRFHHSQQTPVDQQAHYAEFNLVIEADGSMYMDGNEICGLPQGMNYFSYSLVDASGNTLETMTASDFDPAKHSADIQ